ncbi:hypothetical protein BASA60_001961 [Batrachochytrium salamandrivorans]|nr:hypothetical protein BASA60_001961 [Batrachochytrium salamandrivorans]
MQQRQQQRQQQRSNNRSNNRNNNRNNNGSRSESPLPSAFLVQQRRPRSRHLFGKPPLPPPPLAEVGEETKRNEATVVLSHPSQESRETLWHEAVAAASKATTATTGTTTTTTATTRIHPHTPLRDKTNHQRAASGGGNVHHQSKQPVVLSAKHQQQSVRLAPRSKESGRVSTTTVSISTEIASNAQTTAVGSGTAPSPDICIVSDAIDMSSPLTRFFAAAHTLDAERYAALHGTTHDAIAASSPPKLIAAHPTLHPHQPITVDQFLLTGTNADPLSAGSSSEDDLVQLPGEFVNMSHPNKRGRYSERHGSSSHPNSQTPYHLPLVAIQAVHEDDKDPIATYRN